MLSDFIDNLPDVLTASTIPLFRKWQIEDMIVDDLHFHKDVLNTKFKAVTFTVNASVVNRCTHLIYSKQIGDGEFPKRLKCRRAENIHTKLYILNNEVWAGSMNLVTPGGWHNMMVRLSDEQAESACLYFKRLWQLATP